MKTTIATLLHDWGLTLLGGFAGAMVALAYMPGLTLRQQLSATLAGGLTASFVCWALQDWFHLSSAAAGGLSFVMGLVAFRATPSLMAAVAASVEQLPHYLAGVFAAIADRIRSAGGKP